MIEHSVSLDEFDREEDEMKLYEVNVLKLQKECFGKRVRTRSDDDVEENVETQYCSTPISRRRRFYQLLMVQHRIGSSINMPCYFVILAVEQPVWQANDTNDTEHVVT